jgi:TonB-linked SusC/RagA family outer membrane protein
MVFCIASFAQEQQKVQWTIGGTVYDENNESLPGATVFIKDRVSIGTTTDVNGKFKIKAYKGEVIMVSFIGYAVQEYPVTKEESNIKIILQPDTKQVDEVVVVGLGAKQRRISSVAAVTTVDTKELQTPVASVANLLGGRVAGVISIQGSGEPGKNISDFWVRGIGTFGANSGALVLIDGLEGDINSIDPADIESFSVLKDASATAVYGVRGANGVVLVTTKRGEAGKLKITGRANVTLSHLTRKPDYLRAYDYALLANEANEVRGETRLYSDIELDIIKDNLDPDIYPDVSWQDEVLRPLSVKRGYYASAQGGAQAARYFLSLGGSSETAAYNVDKDSPYAANVGYNTYSYRANIDFILSESTKVYFGTDGFLSIHNEPGVANTDYIWQAQATLNPLILPVKYSNGQYPAVGMGAQTSPWVMTNYMGRRSTQVYQGKVTLALSQDLNKYIKGLSFRAQGAYDITSNFNEMRLIMPELYQAIGRTASGELQTVKRVNASTASYNNTTDQYRKYHFETTVNYDRVLEDVHHLSGLLYYYLSDQKRASDGSTNINSIPVRYQGFSGRATYNYADTYMLDWNFGLTGSENFQPGRQYGFFQSVALGWVPSSYDAFKDIMPWFDFLKFRGSYGSVGNDRLTSRRFPYLTMVSVNNNVSPWGSSSVMGVTETTMGADNLVWEKAIKADLGIEAKLLDNAIELTVDVFHDKRDGIFMQRVQVPSFVGVASMPFGNVGAMVSYGSDGNISYNNQINKEIGFTVRANYTYSKNDVKNWEEANPKYPYQENAGYPNGTIRGLHAVGLFKDQHDIDTSPAQTFGSYLPGDIKYRDVNGDGRIDSDDATPLSYDTYPLLMYGFGGEFRYKGVRLNVLFKGTGKTDYFRVGRGYDYGYVPFYYGATGNVLSIVNDPKNRWIPAEYAAAHGIPANLAENPNALYPRLQYGANSNNARLSDFWKGDSRYLRLQEVSINYNLAFDVLRKIGISSIDCQLIGQNLCVWDKVKLFDPEQATNNGVVYPIPTSYTLQLYINL